MTTNADTHDDSRMTPEEFREAREKLGLSVGKLALRLALRLGVDVRTVRRWQNGHHDIPTPVAVAIIGLLRETA